MRPGSTSPIGQAATGSQPFLKGIAFTPHAEYPDKGVRFAPMIDELAATGATHMSMVVQWSQPDVRASAVAPHPVETQDDAVVRQLIRRARAKGLEVMVFPIIWVEQRKIGEWRGTLAPADPEAWWASYRRFILHYAALAKDEGAGLFSVGSELASLEREEARWRALIAEVRGVFPGKLLYSANWDHYEPVPFWDALDYVGLTGYYELVSTNDATEEAMRAAWIRIRDGLTRWQAGVGRPLVFTEIGYPSIDGGARQPWNYTAVGAVDHEEQRRAYAAFRAAWEGHPALGGVFFWNWFGLGGPTCGDYTPRLKPAAAVIRSWFAAEGAR